MKKIIFALFTFTAILFISCGNSKSTSTYGVNSAVKPAARSKMSSLGFAASRASESEPMYADMEMAAEESVAVADDIPADFERKLIKTGNLTIEVSSFDEAQAAVADFVKAFSGYTTNSYVAEDYYNVTVKIPAVKFETAMESANNIGKVKYKSENSQDVTDEFYDLESRLETKRILKEKFESYLKQSKDMKELLEVEKQLNEVISDLEAMESRMKRLNGQIEYSTIYINMNLPSGYVNSGYNWPDMGEKFGDLGYGIVNFFANLLMFIIYAVIFGIPVIAIIALLYWLFFGRIGLMVKLFKWLSKKKQDK